MTLQDFLTKYCICDLGGLVSCIKMYGKQLPVDCVYQAAEFLNPNRDLTAAFYTDTAICKKIMAELPAFTEKDHIRILEPSVGAGNFLPFIAEKYKTKRILELYLIDIDDNVLRIAELIFETFFRDKYSNVAIIYINDDYLKFPVAEKKFDLVIGNPPYAKIKDYNLQREYRKNSKITKSSNLFVWFLEKAYHDGDWISLIVPKSILNAPEYDEIREIIKNSHIKSILDFGENGFKGVKIETVNLIFNSQEKSDLTHVVSITQKIDIIQQQEYITDNNYPSWLIYRNSDFDRIAEDMQLGVFDAFRDRQIVNSMLSQTGKYRVLKSRNIGSNSIVDIAGYDSYISDINNLAVSRYINVENVVLVPNLSYAPRACFLPKNTIANGSVAFLTLKNNNTALSETDLDFFATREFRLYYRIARNYGTRSLNIDNNSVFYFGIRRKK